MFRLIAAIGNPPKYCFSVLNNNQRSELTTMLSDLSRDSSDNISPTRNRTIANTTNFHGGVAGVFKVTVRVTKRDGNSVA